MYVFLMATIPAHGSSKAMDDRTYTIAVHGTVFKSF